MKRWLMVPLTMAAVLALTPASEGRGSKTSCCAPTYCIVGYESKIHNVASHEWVTEKQTIKVTEYVTEKVKKTYTKYEAKTYTEKKPYTYYVDELVKGSRDEDYYTCEPYTEIVEKPYTVHEPYTVEKTGTKKVARTVVTEEPRKYTIYEEVRTPKTGTKKVSRIATEEVPYSYTVDQGHWETQCHDQVCYSRKHGCCDPCCHVVKCYKKVWVSKPVVVAGKHTVHKCIWVDEPYTYTEISHKPVIKEEKVKVTSCVWADEPFKYTETHYKAVQKVEKVTVHKTKLVKHTRKVDFYTCVKKEMKGEHTYTFCKYEPVSVEVLVDVSKPILVDKVIDVKKCITVYKPVEVKVPIYGCVSHGCCK